MTDKELQRLNELDNIISWESDTGRTLTEEERKEHALLAWQFLLEDESPEMAMIYKKIAKELGPKLPGYIERIEKATDMKLSDRATVEIKQILTEVFIHGAEVGAEPIE